MKKIYFLGSLFALLQINLNAQMGIDTTTPNATLEVAASPNDRNKIDGIIPPKLSGDELKAKDNLYQSLQEGSIVYVTSPVVMSSPKTVNVTEIGYYYFDGTVWQIMKSSSGGSITATNGLTKSGDIIKLGGNLSEVTTIGTSAINTLRLSGLQPGNINNQKILMLDTITGDVQLTNTLRSDLSIPSPAIFRLESTLDNFLNGYNAGFSQIVPFTEIKNTIVNLTYNPTTRTVTLPPGAYQISFVYEAIHNTSSTGTNCTLSSYYVDFPMDMPVDFQRIHSTASHGGGNISNHGGTINFVTTLTNQKDWQLRFGRGQSGNCSGTGMRLGARATHLLIYRIGD